MKRLFAAFSCIAVLLVSAAAKADTQSFVFTPSGTSAYYLPFGQNGLTIPDPTLTATFTDLSSGSVQLTITAGAFQSYMGHALSVGFLGINLNPQSNLTSGQISNLHITAVSGNANDLANPGVLYNQGLDHGGTFNVRLQWAYGAFEANQTQIYDIGGLPNLVNADNIVANALSTGTNGGVQAIAQIIDGQTTGDVEDYIEFEQGGNPGGVTTPEPSRWVGLSGIAGMLLFGLVWRRRR